MSDGVAGGFRADIVNLAYNGANYVEWEESITDLMAREGLSLYVMFSEDGTPSRPPPPRPNKPEEETEEHALALEVYTLKCGRALGFIRPTLRSHRVLIQGLTHPAVVMWTIQKKFKATSSPDPAVLMREYNDLRPKGDDFESYMIRLDALTAGLRTCGIDRSDFEVLQTWLSALQRYPEGHPYRKAGDFLHMSYTTTRRLERPVMEALILSARHQIKEKDVVSPDAERAFYSSGSRETTCWCCGGTGHIARGCAKRPRDGCFSCGKAGHKSSQCTHPEVVKFRKGKRREEKAAPVTTSSDAAMESESQLSVSSYLVSDDATIPGGLIALVDSGCSRHMFGVKDFFDYSPNYRRYRVPVVVGSGDTLYSEGIGDVLLSLKGVSLHLPACLFVPGLSMNLLSVSQMDKAGCAILFSKGEARLCKDSEEIVMATKLKSNLYEVTLKPLAPESAHPAATGDVWHRRLGHVNSSALKRLHESVEGFPRTVMPDRCSSCTLAKMTRASFPTSTTTTVEPLELLSVDLAGPFDHTIGGARYFMIVVDDFSKNYHVELLRNKSGAVGLLKLLVRRWETQLGKRVKVIRSDNGGEFDNGDMAAFCTERGIRQQMTTARTPEQNGAAERAVRTTKEGIRALLIESGLEDKYWGAAARNFIYVRNRTKTPGGGDKTAHEMFTGVKPHLSHIRVFGCVAYMHIPREDRVGSVWKPKARPCVFLGYGDAEDKAKKAWILFDPCTEKKYVTTHVTFCEDQRWADRRVDTPGTSGFLDSLLPPRLPIGEVPANAPTGEADLEPVTEEAVPENTAPESSEDLPSSLVEGVQQPRGGVGVWGGGWTYQEESESPLPIEPVVLPEGAKRVRRQPARFAEQGMVAEHDDKSMEEMLHLEYACSTMPDPEEPRFREAKRDEMASMAENGVWTLVPRDECLSRVIGVKWVCNMKDLPDGSQKAKARLVAQGHRQREGIDFQEIFAPVVKLESIRYILARACVSKMRLAQGDVKTAFLTSPIGTDENIYVEQPKGFVQSGKEDYVCKLNKAIYGLHQSPRLFYRHILSKLTAFGFEKTPADPSVFIRQSERGKVILALYVDDSLIAADTDELVQETKAMLDTEFQMKWTDDPKVLLGIEIERSPDGSITLSQRKFAKEILEQFGMLNANTVKTPIDQVIPAYSSGAAPPADTRFPFREFIGKANYLARGTRPDLAFAISHLASFSSSFQETQWKACERVMKYIRGTIDMSIAYSPSGNVEVLGYSDADHAADPGDRRSIGAYVFTLASGPISWSSKKQSTVALSSTEAEYMAMGEAGKEALWLKKLDKGLGFDEDREYVRIFEDNEPAIALAKNDSHHGRTKHLDTQHHAIRQWVETGVIRLEWLSTKRMIADLLTKPITSKQLRLLCEDMNVKQRSVHPSESSVPGEETVEGKC